VAITGSGSSSSATVFSSSYRLFNPINHKDTTQQAGPYCGGVFVDGRFVFDFTALFDVALRDVRGDAEVFDFPMEQFAVGQGQAAPGRAGWAQKKDVWSCREQVVREEIVKEEVVKAEVVRKKLVHAVVEERAKTNRGSSSSCSGGGSSGDTVWLPCCNTCFFMTN
jgi:hypothetical protein